MQKIMMPTEDYRSFMEVFEMFVVSQTAKGVAEVTLKNYKQLHFLICLPALMNFDNFCHVAHNLLQCIFQKYIIGVFSPLA